MRGEKDDRLGGHGVRLPRLRPPGRELIPGVDRHLGVASTRLAGSPPAESARGLVLACSPERGSSALVAASWDQGDARHREGGDAAE